MVFDRFLARAAAELGDRVIVKGGVVLELRLARARTTRDIDLRVMGDPAVLEAQLRAAGARDLGDHLIFEVRADPTHPTIEGEGIVYEGRRFRATADRLIAEPEVVTGSTALEFAGIAASRFRVYPRESHVAEKQTGPFDGIGLRAALDATFALRGTHPPPMAVPAPPAAWTDPTYARIA